VPADRLKRHEDLCWQESSGPEEAELIRV
jgi:hypothetical protein